MGFSMAISFNGNFVRFVVTLTVVHLLLRRIFTILRGNDDIYLTLGSYI